MEKKLEDYLKYYIGQECRHDNNKMRRFEINHALLTWPKSSFPNLKPLLRRLSSMTEEEALKMVYLPKGAQILKSEKGRKFWTFDYRWVNENPQLNNKDGFAYSDVAFYLNQSEFTSDQFHYLLSKGFDLFGLIDSGLAIDKDL